MTFLSSEVFARGTEAPGERPERLPVVIAGDTVGADHTAAAAAVEQGQFLPAAHPQADGVHEARAEAAPVAHHHVHVTAAQAVRAVVALAGARRFPLHRKAAVGAEEGLSGLIQRCGIEPRAGRPGHAVIPS